MIGKVVRGNDIGGLLRYLFGPGRTNEHANPHVIAAWDDGLVVTQTPEGDPRRLKHLTALLGQPLAALDNRPSPAVWHCSLRTAPGDRELTDAEWADVAAEVLHQTGLAPRGDPAACRWIAVRHADDHIHLAVTLARQDARRARTSHDYARLGAACRTVESRYGLTVTPARDRTSPRRPTRAEVEKAKRARHLLTPRQQLRHQVRRAAMSTTDLASFVEHLQASGVHVRLRYSELGQAEVTGYAVAHPQGQSSSGDLVWFGGGKLAPQLSLPRLSAGWRHSTVSGQAANSRGLRPALSPESILYTSASVVRRAEQGDLSGALAVLANNGIRARGRRRG